MTPEQERKIREWVKRPGSDEWLEGFSPKHAARFLLDSIDRLRQGEGRCRAHAAWNAECPGCLESQLEAWRTAGDELVNVVAQHRVGHDQFHELRDAEAAFREATRGV